MNSDDIDAVLRAYPQIYLACHVDHRTRQASPAGITAREASFLAHVEASGSSPAALARHIGISPSTLSAVLARLESHGLLTIEPDPRDGRRRIVRLTGEGRRAVSQGSVLEADRVEAMLAELDTAERDRAVAGLVLLAAAARRYRERIGK